MSNFSFSKQPPKASKPANPSPVAKTTQGATPAGAPAAKPAAKGKANGQGTRINLAQAGADQSAKASPKQKVATDAAVEPPVVSRGMPDFSSSGDFFVPPAGRAALNQMIDQKAQAREQDKEPGQASISANSANPSPAANKSASSGSKFSFSNPSSEPDPMEGAIDYDGFDANELSRDMSDEDAFSASMMDDGDFVGGIIQPKGAGRHVSIHPLAGVPDSAFEGFDPTIPPGSHYESWVWDCLDKEGHVTIELYVDSKEQEEQESYGANAPYQHPVYNPAKHCLISVPDYIGAPWGVARRIMMTPQTMRKLPEPKQYQPKKEPGKFPKFNAKPGSDGKQEEVKPPPPVFVSDPSGIAGWLNNTGITKPHHNVIFGRCIIADSKGKNRKTRDGEGYWMIVSENDARRVQSQVHGDDPAKTRDTAQLFGLEGVNHSQDVKTDRRYETQTVPLNERKPVPATRRYFGEWRNESSTEALTAAHQKVGPVMPADWTQEDVDFLANSHSFWRTLREDNAEAESQESIISPLDANPELVDMIPERAEQRARANQSIPAPRMSRMRG